MCGQLACAEKVFISFRKLSTNARLIFYSMQVLEVSQFYDCTVICTKYYSSSDIKSCLRKILLAIFIFQNQILKQLDYEVNNTRFLVHMHFWCAIEQTQLHMIFLSTSGMRQKLILHFCERWNKCQSCRVLMSGKFWIDHYWTKIISFLAFRKWAS